MNPYSHADPARFSGRFRDREYLLQQLDEARRMGRVVLVTGTSGSGKTSLLRWLEEELQRRGTNGGSPVILAEFPETEGLALSAFRDVLTGIKEHGRYGWLQRAVQRNDVRTAVDIVLAGIDVASKCAGHALIGAGAAMARTLLHDRPLTYADLTERLVCALKVLSEALAEHERILTIMLDDVQLCSEEELAVLRDIVRNLPTGILLVLAFELRSPYMGRLAPLKELLLQLGHTEVRLEDMTCDEIRELAMKRYQEELDPETLGYLSANVGHPRCLISCFELLQQNREAITTDSIRAILPEAVDWARFIYNQLSQDEQKRVDRLCVLADPMPLSLIGCMLDTSRDGLVQLNDELQRGIAFIRREPEWFEFCHASLRTARRAEIPRKTMRDLSLQADACIEKNSAGFPDQRVPRASRFENCLRGEKHDASLALGLELGLEAYRLSRFRDALRYARCARKSAVCIHNRLGEGATLHLSAAVYRETERFEDALRDYKNDLEIRRETGDLIGEAITLHQIGRVLERAGRKRDAQTSYAKSLEITKELGDHELEAAMITQMAGVFAQTDKDEQLAATLSLDPLRRRMSDLATRLMGRLLPDAPTWLGCTSLEGLVRKTVGFALAASGLLGETEPSSPQPLVRVRPIFSGIRDLSELTFDWNPMEGAVEYNVRLILPKSDDVYLRNVTPPLAYPERFPRDLPRGQRIDWVVAGQDAQARICGAFRGTFWLVPPEELQELDLELAALQTAGPRHPWVGDLYQQHGLNELAISGYLELVAAPEPSLRALGYAGAIGLWQGIHGELRKLRRFRLADAVQAELFGLQKALETELEME